MSVLRYCCFRWLVYDRALVFEPSRPLACIMMLVWLIYVLELSCDIFLWVPDLHRTRLRAWLVYDWIGGVTKRLGADMAKLTLSNADLTVLTAFIRKRLVANVCRIMIYGHMHCIDMCPPLSLPSELLKNKRHHAHLILAHTSHTYYYSRGECSLGIVYCTLTKRTVHARTSSLTPTRGYT